MAVVYGGGSVWGVVDLINATRCSGHNSSVPVNDCCVLPGFCVELLCLSSFSLSTCLLIARRE